MRDSSGIMWGCLVGSIVLLGLIVTQGKGEAPNLECSVDDTLTFIAYDVQAWDMRAGTLTVESEEGGKSFVMARTMLAGETCRETKAQP